MSKRVAIILAVCTVLLFLPRLSPAAAEERTAAQLLPATTAVYVEIRQPMQLLDTALEHPMRAKLESIEDVKKGLESEQFEQFLGAVRFIELQIDMKWQEALEAITAGGLYAGIDAETEGLVVLAKSRDEKTLTKVRETLISLARQDAKNKGNPDPFEEKDYRGITAYKIQNNVFAQVGTWLMVTNKGELAKVIADTYLDGSDATLAGNKNFTAARESIDGEPAALAFADVGVLRDKGVAKELFREKSDNPLAELLLGGILNSLQDAPYATGTLYFEAEQTKLVASLPHDPANSTEARQFYFGPEGNGAAPKPLLPNETLLSIVTYRDVGEFWLAKEELFEENIVAQLAQADSQFSTLFAGLDFGQEVLGAVQPEIQIVLARQDFAHLDTPEPDIKLPTGAMIFRLKEPEKMQRRLKVAYQSLIGFANIGLAQQGQPQLDIETETRGDTRIVSATYLPDETKKGAIAYNFSPSIAFVGDRFIIAGTRQLAVELAELAADQTEQQAAGENTQATLDAQVLHDVLADNREHLVAQNVLEKGHAKADAEKEIGTVLDLLGIGKDASLQLKTTKDKLSLEVQLRFKK